MLLNLTQLMHDMTHKLTLIWRQFIQATSWHGGLGV